MYKGPKFILYKITESTSSKRIIFYRTRGFWSGEGCHMTHRNKSHTTCQCYHLTSFAVLMRVKDVHKNPVMVST